MKNFSAPRDLLQTQYWFGAMIAQPFRENQKIPLSSRLYANVIEEAEKYISPSPTMRSHQRIEIYHQQYWWRLLKCLQENFPFVTRLFGYKHFNHQIAIPYLTKYPPRHWALSRLGDNLTEWILEAYNEDDRELIAAAASIDWAAQKAFWVTSFSTIKTNSSEELLSQSVCLQPHISLFSLNLDLFSFRDEFLKEEVDYWNDHPFPEIEREKCHFVVYRTPNNLVAWDKISLGEHKMLSFLREGKTIQESCTQLESDAGEALEQAQELMPLWFKRWVSLNWLSCKND